MDWTHDLLREISDAGASLAGVADLSALPEEPRLGLPFGISVAVKYPVRVTRGIADGPTREYFDYYHSLNAQLDALVAAGAKLLTDAGYRAVRRRWRT